MKKLFFSTSMIIIAAISAKAQVQYGIKGGMNVSNIFGAHSATDDGDIFDNENPLVYSTRIGYYGGAFANIPVKGIFSLQPEIIYSLQGAHYKQTVTDPNTFETITYSGNQNLSYLQVPIMAKFTFNKKFFAQTGPQIGYLLGAKAKSSGQTTTNTSSFNTIDFDWGIGGGYIFPSGIGVELRYSFGITAVNKHSDDSDDNTDNNGFGELQDHNTNLQVGVLYIFGGNSNDD